MVEPDLKLLMQQHEMLRRLLEELFQIDDRPNTAAITGNSSILPASMEDSNTASISLSPDLEKDHIDLEAELPQLAPLEVPQFDFNM